MDTYMCHVSLSNLAAEVCAIPLARIPNGSGHGHFSSKAGWINGLSLTRVRLGETYPLLTQAVEELQIASRHHKIEQVIINKLDPGALLDTHRDGYPQNDRYHLPIITNSEAYWWDELEGKRHMVAGRWHGPVPYCGILHSAGNPGMTDRLHVIVDFEHEKGNF